MTRRMHGGFGGECEGLGIEKLGILGMWWRVRDVVLDEDVTGEDS